MQENRLWTKEFIILCFSNFILSFSFYSILAILPVYLSNQLSFLKTEIGPVMAAYTLGALLIRPFSGYAFDVLDKKKVLLISIFSFALLFILYAFFNNAVLISLLRFVHGFTWGFVTTGMVTVSIDIIPASKRGEGIGFLGISMTLAMALAPPVAIALSKWMSFHSLFYGATVIAAISFVIALFLRIHSPAMQEKHKVSLSLFVRSALPVSLSVMLFSIAYGGIMSFITLYAIELEIINAGRFFLFLAIGLIITRFFSGKIFDRFGPRWISISGFLAGIIGLVLLSLVHGEFLFLIAAVLIGLGFGSIVPAAQAMINNLVAPQRRGAANSTFLTFFDMGIGLGMVLTGAISGIIGYRGSYLICAGISAIGLILFMSIALRKYLLKMNTN